ncbi:MAG TPA: choice-of-anchor J domain-containing protein, partial [Candidatus Cloacimonadota bacterium]|nr:choice-of-anchor J domain-containing protein [Candidatus Cloacimonadota bacterium]
GDKCVTSASYDNNTGALTPDNYLITPMVSLATNATSYNIKYWVAPQDPAYYNESYSLMISTTGTNIADFTTLISETLTNTEWVQRTYPLDSYIGQNVFIAFRHHNSTDIYMIKIDDIEIDRTLASDPEVIVPVITQTVLKGNYPNPFNPETSIAFDLATEGNVSIDIYNAKGQKVKTLVNDRYGVGAHSVVWNGKDDNGKNVGSGIYFFNMKSGKYTSTRKMILMK